MKDKIYRASRGKINYKAAGSKIGNLTNDKISYNLVNGKIIQMENRMNFLELAFLGMSAFALEIVIYWFEIQLHANTVLLRGGLTPLVFHMSVTCFAWIIAAYMLFRYGEEEKDFSLLQFRTRPDTARMSVSLILTGAVVLLSAYFNGFMPRAVVELLAMTDRFGLGGFVLFLFEYMYYFFQTILVLLTISFAQEYFDRKLRKSLPWGGMFVGALLGGLHTLSRGGATGLQTMVCGLVGGVVYLLLHKNPRYTIPVLFALFAL